jgi:hypothetical protein
MESLFLLAFDAEEFLAALAMAGAEAFFNKLLESGSGEQRAGGALFIPGAGRLAGPAARMVVAEAATHMRPPCPGVMSPRLMITSSVP